MHQLIDFFIGLTIANSLPHFMVGLTHTRFLGLFGYGDRANMAYSVFSILVSLVLFHINYGITRLFEIPLYLGALIVALAYLFGGKILITIFSKTKDQNETA